MKFANILRMCTYFCTVTELARKHTINKTFFMQSLQAANTNSMAEMITLIVLVKLA